MTTATTTLADFLLREIAADEAAARDRNRLGNPPGIRRETWDTETKRRLALCSALRAVVELHAAVGQSGIPGCAVCLTDRVGYSDDWGPDDWPCDTLRRLAAAFADRPGFREEWVS